MILVILLAGPDADSVSLVTGEALKGGANNHDGQRFRKPVT